MFEHFVSATCQGEQCRCGQPATHKVGEEIPDDDPSAKPGNSLFFAGRHNFTAYVCCRCFGELFGPAAQRFCQS